MWEAFSTTTNYQMDKFIDDEVKGDKIPSPVNDMVDAYWLLQTGLNLHLSK